MPAFPLVLGFLASLISALVLVPLVRDAARRAGWLDAPDGERKHHSEAVPSVGGIAIAGSILLGLVAMGSLVPLGPVLSSPLVLVGAIVILAVGLWDDLLDVSPRVKLIAQFVVAGAVFAGGTRFEGFDAALGGGALALAVSAVLTVVWMVGVMNAVNLIDGMDGLAAGTSAIAITALAAIHTLHGDVAALGVAVVTVGALVGFLRYNFAPASVFMGDSGSLVLGYVLGVFALRGPAHADPVLALVIPAVVVGVPILDLLVSVVRRWRGGLGLFAPDRDHLHHRLESRMPTHRAALVLYGLGALLGVGALAMATLPALAAVAVLVAGTAVVYGLLCYVAYLPAPRRARTLVERRQAQRTASAKALSRGGRLPESPLQPASGPER